MSRITGKDAANLIEAYNSLYAPQEEVELTEEQVQEDFENWVNSLVEEGHDLSEYTWEDMYEHYLNEAPIRYSTGPTAADLQRQRAQASARPTPAATGYNPAGGGMGGMRGSGRDRNATQTSSSPGALRARPTSPTQQNLRGLSIGPGGFNINNRPVQTTPTRPAPAPARPAQAPATRPAPAPTAPVSQRPTAAPAPAAPARTFNPLMQRTFGYQTGNAPSQIAAASAGKPIPSGTALGSAANPEVRKKLNLPQKNLNQDLDLFDIVKGYLIDEGYAETEEAAAVIMANMSEEWREEILDERNRGEQGMSDAQVRGRRDTRDFGHVPGGFSGGVRVGGQKRKDHDHQRGVKKQKGKVLPHMRGPNDNVSNYHAVRGED